MLTMSVAAKTNQITAKPRVRTAAGAIEANSEESVSNTYFHQFPLFLAKNAK
jgi:hypothetical protein